MIRSPGNRPEGLVGARLENEPITVAQPIISNPDINKMPKRSHPPTAGMTLMEVLVVVAIIGLLIGLLMPAVQVARASSRRMQCLSNLHEIGVAFENRRTAIGQNACLPNALQMPSAKLEDDKRPTIAACLAKYIEGDTAVFICPSDTKYHLTEGLSYEYPTGRLGGKTYQQALKDMRGNTQSSSVVLLLYDFDAFHSNQTRGVLFLDGHADCQ